MGGMNGFLHPAPTVADLVVSLNKVKSYIHLNSGCIQRVLKASFGLNITVKMPLV